MDVLGGGETPAEFSDDDDDHPRNKALNKQALLEWVTVADFTKEISLTKIAHHKYKLEPEEIQELEVRERGVDVVTFRSHVEDILLKTYFLHLRHFGPEGASNIFKMIVNLL